MKHQGSRPRNTAEVAEPEGVTKSGLSQAREKRALIRKDSGDARVWIDGEPVVRLPLRKESHGASYLRLRAISETAGHEGFLIESVSVKTKEY